MATMLTHNDPITPKDNPITVGFIYILESSNSSSFTCLALEATETVFELVTEMAVELINIHLISVQQKRLV